MVKTMNEAVQLARDKQDAMEDEQEIMEIKQRLARIEKFIQAIVDHLGLEFQYSLEVIRCGPKKAKIDEQPSKAS